MGEVYFVRDFPSPSDFACHLPTGGKALRCSHKNIFAVVPPFRFRKRNVSGLSYTLCVYSDNMKKSNKS